MDIDSFLRDPVSRRRLFRTSGVSVAGGAAMFLAACGRNTASPVADGPDESDQADVEILNGALDLELMSVVAYKDGAARLGGDALRLGKTLLEQEQAHADGLSTAITDAGGRPNRAKASYDFPALRTQDDVLKFVLDLESTAIAAYTDALPKLTQGDLRSQVASIITNEAEHVSVLLDALGREPVPDAFVTGKLA